MEVECAHEQVFMFPILFFKSLFLNPAVNYEGLWDRPSSAFSTMNVQAHLANAGYTPQGRILAIHHQDPSIFIMKS
jgi:hypothetical protein